MPEMHLKQPGFTYSACGPFPKNKKRIEKFKETADTSYIYKNVLDKACFQCYMAYRDFKDLEKRTASNKVLRNKAFNVAKNPKLDAYQRRLASTIYKYLNKKSKDRDFNIEMMHNEQLAEELDKPIIGNFKKRTVYSRFKDNI